MQHDPIWLAFAETGDPLCYLLYRAVQAAERDGRRSESRRL